MFSLNCKGKLLLIEKPLVMGILNITGDSFYQGSRLEDLSAIKNKAIQMVGEGVDILDVGAQSTRPGSKRISAEEELKKIIPAIDMLRNLFPEIFISIDTYHAEVARKAVNAGAVIVNDISAGEMDEDMIETVASLHVPYVCMHMKGVPETMQELSQYEDVTKEVLDFFIQKTATCKHAGIVDVIIDPGFGFGKNISQNLLLLKNLEVFKMFERPIMTGLSRKSAIYKILKTDAENSLNGTTVLHTLALQNGASILRVHDVEEARQAIDLFEAYGKA